MYISNITNDYDNVTSSKYTEYDKMTFFSCRNKESNTDIIIPALLFTIPCGLPFLCLIGVMVYRLIKPLIKS